MVSKSTLALLEMETIEDYFEYIIESKLNGQHAQAIQLFNELSQGMQGQRADFFLWAEATYYYEAQDSDEQDELGALREYFKRR